MHTRPGDELPAAPRNSDTAMADPTRTAPQPPEGGWPVWYLTDEDDVGESTEQGITVRLLLAALTELARERRWTHCLVAGDQFFAWVEAEPLVRISPDVYVLDDPPAPPYPGMWQTWRPGHAAPRFAVEVVSDEWRKDYDVAPAKYRQLGTRELIIFDPEVVHTPRGSRVALQVFRRDEAGALVREIAGPGPVYSVELDAWLVVTPGPRLRIARDAAGEDLVRTAEEQLHGIVAENAALRRDNAELRSDNAELRSEIAELRSDNAELRRENAELRRDNAELRDRVVAQADRIDALESTVREQAATIREQAATIREQAATIQAQAAIIEEQGATIRAQAAIIQAQAATIQALEAKVASLEATVARLLAHLA